jgi:hypothetical protein
MILPFSPAITTLLNRMRTSNALTYASDFCVSTDAGRSLGPASGNLWDVWPFLAPSRFTGLFAGLSISGLTEEQFPVGLLSYRNRYGYVSRVHDGFYWPENGWQTWDEVHWLHIGSALDWFLSSAPARPDIPPLVHDLDLTLRAGDTLLDTRTWDYTSRKLSPDYRSHTWKTEHSA